MNTQYRIGNLIAEYDCAPYYFPIEEIKKNAQGLLAVYYREGSCISFEPEPIQLTEEWLLKFGFINHNNYFIDNRSDYELLLKENKVCIIFHEQLCAFYGIEIKYVHQLQNLFYCLTGIELTTNK